MAFYATEKEILKKKGKEKMLVTSIFFLPHCLLSDEKCALFCPRLRKKKKKKIFKTTASGAKKKVFKTMKKKKKILVTSLSFIFPNCSPCFQNSMFDSCSIHGLQLLSALTFLLRVCGTSLLKTLWQKAKLLITKINDVDIGSLGQVYQRGWSVQTMINAETTWPWLLPQKQ